MAPRLKPAVFTVLLITAGAGLWWWLVKHPKEWPIQPPPDGDGPETPEKLPDLPAWRRRSVKQGITDAEMHANYGVIQEDQDHD